MISNAKKKILKGMTLDELKEYFISIGESKFRGEQLFNWIYNHISFDFSEMQNFPKDLRNRLNESTILKTLELATVQYSPSTGTKKFLYSTTDNKKIESVLIPEDDRNTLCISTQVGCAMGCVFCATGQMGFKRHLTAGEIVEQVLYYARQLKADSEKVTNIVLMGMGEPFHNYEATMKAIDLLGDPTGFGLGARRFTISTVGLVPMIKRFADEKRQVNLAISLHAVDDSERSSLMPVNKKYPINDIIDACKYYLEKTNRRITFEWALIAGKNDSEQTAQKLANLLKGLLCHVNAIPLNPTSQSIYQASDREQTIKFQKVLEKNGIPCTIRLRRGIDIQAGCGQLAIHHTS